ncbi:unnamed protein product [Cuscuta epithymum]|uniref:Uncharacterized protein n=1 Tax=Cuscuta epithymum TaxID=186058 RepID=A0AAV0EN96_9ASTE|nr:unnamed protein product [Cuscuta epithymum]
MSVISSKIRRGIEGSSWTTFPLLRSSYAAADLPGLHLHTSSTPGLQSSVSDPDSRLAGDRSVGKDGSQILFLHRRSPVLISLPFSVNLGRTDSGVARRRCRLGLRRLGLLLFLSDLPLNFQRIARGDSSLLVAA